MDNRTKTFGISALTLKLLAMTFMLLDHLWATVWSVPWFALVGRLAFPIFAFQIAEGFFLTSDRRRYILRLLVFALISEIPFNLILADSAFYPLHQNVMFSFLIALLLMQWMERERGNPLGFAGVSAVCVLLATVLGLATFVDYYHYGVLMVLLFYWTRGMRFAWLVQLLGMLYINDAMAGLVYPVTLFGQTVEIGQQMIAVLALVPIWLYNGEKGYSSKAVQLACYWFYPVHLSVLYGLSVLMH